MARGAALKLFLISGIMLSMNASAQFLRLGPFDFFSKTGLEAIYTTNVEGERPSEATDSREDYYLVWSLDLSAVTRVGPQTTLSVDTGVAIEKHFIREDLDNSGSPFGRFNARFNSDWDPIFVYGGFSYEKTSDSVDEKFVPADQPKKTRQVGTTTESELGADWIEENYQFGISFTHTEDRYDDEVYAIDEQDEDKMLYYGEVKLFQYVSIRYEVEDTKTDFINQEDGEKEDKTENIKINFDQGLGLLERPKVTYSIGVQREYEEGETDGWELIHNLTISDEYDLSSVLRFKVFASYDYEQKPEEDDISFIYGASLEHQISRRASQAFMVTKKPVATLGTTEDTDETTFDYSIRILDIIIPDMSFNGSAGYTISNPVDGPTENKWELSAGLSHTTQLSSSLQRIFKYEYTWEDSNLEDEILDEHRVTLGFNYQF